MTSQSHTDEATALRLERLTAPAAPRYRDDRPALVVPLEGSVIELVRERASTAPAAIDRVDRAALALVPAGTVYRVRALSPITEVATLLLGERARRRALEDYADVVEPLLSQLLAVPRLLPRTRWVDELVHRYVFERSVCEHADSRAAIFVETELVKELFFLCRERDEQRTRDSVVRTESELVVRACAWIDEHFFQTLRVAALARHCHASESTLLRAFQRELGRTPAAYARERRLDAALLLVQGGRHTISEVAAQVGYGNLAAFTAAFHRRFGAPPSAIRRGEGLERLPPEGTPPRRPRRRN